MKALLQEEKKNELRVVLHSPVKYLRERYEKDPNIMIVDEGIRGASYLRKAHCMFGWDWGPRLPDAGIFREVSLLGVDSARFDNVYVIQKHEAGKVELSISAEAEVLGEERLYRYSADGTGAGEVYRYVESTGRMGRIHIGWITLQACIEKRQIRKLCRKRGMRSASVYMIRMENVWPKGTPWRGLRLKNPGFGGPVGMESSRCIP